MAAGKNSLRITRLPVGHAPHRRAPQQDALALRTLDERHVWQTPLGQWACAASGCWACRLDTWARVQLWSAFTGQPVRD